MKNNIKNGAVIFLSWLYFLPCIAADELPSSTKKVTRFDPNFMHFFDHNLILTDFNGEEYVKEGKYRVGININSKDTGDINVSFIKLSKESDAQPCFKYDDIISFDVNTTLLSDHWKDNKCIFIKEMIPDATINFDSEEQKINLTIPQLFLKNTPRDYITPELWEDGVPALTLSYGANATLLKNSNTSEYNRKYENYYYASLITSLKLDSWRIFTNSTLDASSTQGTNWHNQSVSLQRSIAANQSQLAIGDVNTTGVMFNTIPVRGISMHTDDRMFPDSMRIYAPTVRGIAEGNALVTVRQNGNVIYETNVPPGEFVITDLNTSGYSGSLEVMVREANGSVRTQTIPYSSNPQLLRTGYSRFATTTGQIINSNLSDAPFLFEGTYQYGLNDYITTFGGVQTTLSGDYSAINGGLAINTPIGALGLDLTRAFNSVTSEEEQKCSTFCGMSIKASLAKLIQPTNTSFSLIAYRYSSSDYYTLMDALQISDARKKGRHIKSENYREVFETNISQELEPGWGSFYSAGYYGRYWQGKQNKSINYQIGYANNIHSVNYNLSFNRANNRYGNGENTFRLSLSIPVSFGHRNIMHKPMLTTSLSRSERETRLKTSVTGVAGSHHEYSYGAWVGAGSHHDDDAGLNGGYNNGASLINAAYSQGKYSSMTSLGISGGVVAHSGGINLSHSISDTLGIVEAKGATGASVYPYSNSRVAKNGYAIIPSLNPYNYNEISLNSKSAATNIEIEEDRIKVVPTSGAAVSIKFKTKRVNNHILKIKRENGDNVPFGSAVYDKKGNSVGIVGQGGNVILSDIAPQKISVVWSDPESKKRCFVNYIPDSYGNDENLKIVNAICKDADSIIEG